MKKTKKVFVLAIMLIMFLFTVNFVGATYSSNSDAPTSVVNSITVSGSANKITWTVDGTSSQGFKVVWSKNQSPVYPCRAGDQYHYYSDKNTTTDTLDAFDGSGAYYVRVCEYLGGKCGTYSNQITLNLSSGGSYNGVTSITLTDENYDGKNLTWKVDGYSSQGYKVVWSKNEHPTYPTREGDQYHYYSDPNKLSDSIDAFSGDGKYYVRVCEYLGGKCGVYSNELYVQLIKDGEIAKIEETAEKLSNNQLDQILAELEELRNLVKEQQAEIQYLGKLVSEMSKISEAMQTAINSFITYGVDDNTKKLGAGERAAVINSYKEAYGELPGDDSELADVIKIANGRWPSKVSEEALNAAKESFIKVYGRDPNMENIHDSAAVTIMAYGLRQKATNRKLITERNALEIFNDIFEHMPQTTEEWNILQAIAYSGASR
jgi:hypothetical protein